MSLRAIQAKKSRGLLGRFLAPCCGSVRNPCRELAALSQVPAEPQEFLALRPQIASLPSKVSFPSQEKALRSFKPLSPARNTDHRQQRVTMFHADHHTHVGDHSPAFPPAGTAGSILRSVIGRCTVSIRAACSAKLVTPPFERPHSSALVSASFSPLSFPRPDVCYVCWGLGPLGHEPLHRCLCTTWMRGPLQRRLAMTSTSLGMVRRTRDWLSVSPSIEWSHRMRR